MCSVTETCVCSVTEICVQCDRDLCVSSVEIVKSSSMCTPWSAALYLHGLSLNGGKDVAVNESGEQNRVSVYVTRLLAFPGWGDFL